MERRKLREPFGARASSCRTRGTPAPPTEFQGEPPGPGPSSARGQDQFGTSKYWRPQAKLSLHPTGSPVAMISPRLLILTAWNSYSRQRSCPISYVRLAKALSPCRESLLEFGLGLRMPFNIRKLPFTSKARPGGKKPMPLLSWHAAS